MQATFDLGGRVAAVTGASSGIGRAIAEALSEAGASVVLLARRAEAMAAAVSAIEVKGGKAAALSVDLEAVSDWKALADRISEPSGAPDILVNSAGLHLRQPTDEVTAEGWARTIHLNLSVPFFLAQAMVPAMKRKGWGRIVNIASLQSVRAFPTGIAYGSSKGGIAQLTRAMAESWSPSGILCNAIAPGYFPTELTAPVFANDGLAGKLAQQTAVGRNGRMEDLKGPAVFLASEASAFVTGQILFVDGGFTAK